MKPWNMPIAQETEKRIMSYIEEVDDDTTLLDFGAGYGRYLEMFSRHFKKENLFGVENDKKSYETILSKGFNCIVPDPKSCRLPYEDGFFDYIFTSNVIEHIPFNDYKKYLTELRRVLKNEGKLLIGAPSYPFKRIFDIKKGFQTKMYKYYFFDDPTHINRLNIMQYEKDLKELFVDVRLEPTVILFENSFSFFKRNRYRYRFLCDKFFGVAKGKKN